MKKTFIFYGLMLLSIFMVICITGCDKDDDVDITKIKSICCDLSHCYFYRDYWGAVESADCAFFYVEIIDKQINVKQAGDTYIVEAERNDEFNEKISFSFTKNGNKFGPIQNIKASKILGNGNIASLEATNIAYKNSDKNGTHWEGLDSNGMSVSNLKMGDSDDDIGNRYKPDKGNSLYFTITFK